MAKLKVFLSWCFCDFSVVLVAAAVSTTWLATHSQAPVEVFRTVIVQISFLLAASIYGMAWWTVWKRRRSGRGWGIGASLMSVFLWVSMLHFGWDIIEKWFLAFFWVPTILGIVGLIAFSRPNEQSGASPQPLG
jgi:hypothetical protein